MEKENVLEIEITKINDNWSCWFIKTMNKKILKNGIKDKFYINDNWYHFEITEGETDFYYSVKDINSQEEPTLNINYKDDGIPNLIENNEVNDLVLVILEINEKYEIPKRWRARPENRYFSINGGGIILKFLEESIIEDNNRYNLGNYFQTEEEAKKVISSKEWQDFWAKVRAGEIGEEND